MMTRDSGHKRPVNTGRDKRPVNMGRIIKASVRVISKILDLYVKGVINFTNAYNTPLRTMVEVLPNSHRLPRSFTTSILPDYDPPAEGPLVRSISAPAIGSKATNVKLTNFELYMIQRMQSSAPRPRSCNVRMGKIDEDRVSSFRYDDIILKSKRFVDNEDSSKSRSDIDSMLFLE